MPDKNKKAKDNAKRVPSDCPTALIAPSDYEHIFKGFEDEDNSNEKSTSKNSKKSKTKAKEEGAKVPSDQPTALIAPSDYEHIFKGNDDEPKNDKPEPEPKPKGEGAKGVPSDQPAVLIAPSDYEHIYQDEAEDKAKAKAKQTNKSCSANSKNPRKGPSLFKNPTLSKSRQVKSKPVPRR